MILFKLKNVILSKIINYHNINKKDKKYEKKVSKLPHYFADDQPLFI